MIVIWGELFVIQIIEEGNMELIVCLFSKRGGGRRNFRVLSGKLIQYKECGGLQWFEKFHIVGSVLVWGPSIADVKRISNMQLRSEKLAN